MAWGRERWQLRPPKTIRKPFPMALVFPRPQTCEVGGGEQVEAKKTTPGGRTQVWSFYPTSLAPCLSCSFLNPLHSSRLLQALPPSRCVSEDHSLDAPPHLTDSSASGRGDSLGTSVALEASTLAPERDAGCSSSGHDLPARALPNFLTSSQRSKDTSSKQALLFFLF